MTECSSNSTTRVQALSLTRKLPCTMLEACRSTVRLSVRAVVALAKKQSPGAFFQWSTETPSNLAESQNLWCACHSVYG